MFNDKLSNCPICGEGMEKGFSFRNIGLSWIPTEKIKQFAFGDNDLNEAGLKKFLPWKAEYNLSYHCPNCKIYIVDYNRSFSKAEANELAESI
jgi:hypothetical protein